eukprot:6193494-Pleurochrysis_carterae.AAC.3
MRRRWRLALAASDFAKRARVGRGGGAGGVRSAPSAKRRRAPVTKAGRAPGLRGRATNRSGSVQGEGQRWNLAAARTSRVEVSFGIVFRYRAEARARASMDK